MGGSPGICTPQPHRRCRPWVPGTLQRDAQTTNHPSTPSPCPHLGQAQMSPHPLGQTPGCPSSTWAELTAACRWRACGSCCWQSRPCGRGWRRRWPGARPWPWCSAAPAPSRSCTRPWAAPCCGSARSARPPPQAPVLQGNGHGEGLAAEPQGASPCQCRARILLLRES